MNKDSLPLKAAMFCIKTLPLFYQNIAGFVLKHCWKNVGVNADGYARCVGICEIYCRVQGSGVTIDPSTALLCCKSFYIVLIYMLLCAYLK